MATERRRRECLEIEQTKLAINQQYDGGALSLEA